MQVPGGRSKQEPDGPVPSLHKAGEKERTGWSSSIHVVNSQENKQTNKHGMIQELGRTDSRKSLMKAERVPLEEDRPCWRGWAHLCCQVVPEVLRARGDARPFPDEFHSTLPDGQSWERGRPRERKRP